MGTLPEALTKMMTAYSKAEQEKDKLKTTMQAEMFKKIMYKKLEERLKHKPESVEAGRRRAESGAQGPLEKRVLTPTEEAPNRGFIAPESQVTSKQVGGETIYEKTEPSKDSLKRAFYQNIQSRGERGERISPRARKFSENYERELLGEPLPKEKTPKDTYITDIIGRIRSKDPEISGSVTDEEKKLAGTYIAEKETKLPEEYTNDLSAAVQAIQTKDPWSVYQKLSAKWPEYSTQSKRIMLNPQEYGDAAMMAEIFKQKK